MSYFRRIFGLGVLLVIMSLVAFVSLASAHGTTGVAFEDQMVSSNIGMLQTTPTTTATVTTTDQVTNTLATATSVLTGTNDTSGAAQGTVTATTEAGGAAQATATPAGGTQQGTQQQSPGTLPATGGEIGLPWTTLALIVIGGLILFSGLGLALSRRS